MNSSSERGIAFVVKKKLFKKELEYHILEHLIILHLIRNRKHKFIGYTTEDYLFIHGYGYFTRNELYHEIQSLKINEDLINTEFELIKNESKKERKSFIDLVWDNTIYASHPIGNISKPVDIDSIKELIKSITKNDLFLKSSQSEKIIRDSRCSDREITYSNKIDFGKAVYNGGREYLCLYFNGLPDLFYLLSRMLQNYIHNEKRYIYVSDKAKQSAFIFESKVQFPSNSEAIELLDVTKNQLYEEIIKLKKDFFSFALTQLESLTLYNIPWESRVNQIMKIEADQVQEIIWHVKNKK